MVWHSLPRPPETGGFLCDDPEAVPALTPAQRKQRSRERKRAAGLPIRTEAEQQRTRERTRQRRGTPEGKRSEQARRTRKREDKPFVGCDGEGAGTDELDRQEYRLFRMGERELFRDNERLQTHEILDFICDAEPGRIYVGFAFGYDVTMILLDLSPKQRERLFADKETGPGHSRYTYFGEFGVEYLPRNYFRVCRTREIWIEKNGRRFPTRAVIPGTSRTIYDTFAFFQSSFLKAIGPKGWNVATPDEFAAIKRNKLARAEFHHVDDEVRRYCELECRLLADMMHEFREACRFVGVKPRTWNGAGKIAGYLHGEHGTMTAEQVAQLVPDGVLLAARMAYYGGRFEVTRIGKIPGPVYEYDICSAYPAMMQTLPCLLHGQWDQLTPAQLRKLPPGALYVARVRFRHDPPPDGRISLCGLPIRGKDGRLRWPLEGNGVYWSPEIEAASKLGCRVTYRDGWAYRQQCDCKPFDWVQGLYRKRLELGKSTRGYPLKLGINALYGRLAQRIGTPRWANFVWAGLITAKTRAHLMNAAAECPGEILMLATDAIFSTRKMALVLGKELGQWEEETHDNLFIVQPGVYWGPKPPTAEAAQKFKTRGVGVSFFTDHTDRFELAWERWAAQDRAALFGARASLPRDGLWNPPPSVALDVQSFIGLRLAQARNKPDTAGVWMGPGHPAYKPRQISFDWSGKRGRHAWESESHIRTYPQPGGPDVHSLPHGTDRNLIDELDLDKLELDDQPDYVDLSPPVWD